MKYFLIILGVALLGGILYIGLNKPKTNRLNTQNNQEQVSPNADGLIIEDLKIGSGPAAQNSDIVSVNYVGTFLNGTKFDSSYGRNQSFSFVLGQGQVIVGWDRGILGMKVDGKRKLTIPPSLGYGEYGAGNLIPPNATLIFEVELLSIK